MSGETESISLDPEQFARVWKRVVPEGQSCPVELNAPQAASPPSDDFPLGEGALASSAFLREQIMAELRRWRSYQGLTSFAGHPAALHTLARRSHSQAKRLAAALFLITGGWYLPQNQVTPRRWASLRAGFRSLFQSSQRLEAGYRRAAEETRDPLLHQLFLELAEAHRRQQDQIRRMLERL